MGLNRAALDLVSEGFFLKNGTYYFLHHSSVAKLYLDTLVYSHLLEDSTDLTVDRLSSYIRNSKENRIEVFYKLATFPNSINKKEIILSAILQQIKPQEIISQIDKELNIDKLRLFFLSLKDLNPYYAREILLTINSEKLLKKLLEEPCIYKQKELISAFAMIDKDIAAILSKKRPKVALFIPAYNESWVIQSIENVFAFVDSVIVIDDHSSDDTATIASGLGAQVVRHSKNMGYWAALHTGFKEVNSQKFDIAVLPRCRLFESVD